MAPPAAKETKVEGAIVVPLLLNGELFGVFGIANSVSYDFNKEEIDRLLKLGEEICKFLK